VPASRRSTNSCQNHPAATRLHLLRRRTAGRVLRPRRRQRAPEALDLAIAPGDLVLSRVTEGLQLPPQGLYLKKNGGWRGNELYLSMLIRMHVLPI
jgi:hypothetical protein